MNHINVDTEHYGNNPDQYKESSEPVSVGGELGGLSHGFGGGDFGGGGGGGGLGSSNGNESGRHGHVAQPSL